MSALNAITVLATTRIAQLAAINLMAIALILLGLGLFGVAPAVVGCLWATARLEHLTCKELVVGMWSQYRAEFLQANATVLPLLLVAGLLLGFAILGGGLAAAIAVALSVLVIQFAVAAMVAMACMSGSLSDALANARTVSLLGPYRLLAGVLLLPPVALAVVWQPFLGLYFAGSGWALLVNLLLLPALSPAIPNQTFSTEALS